MGMGGGNNSNSNNMPDSGSLNNMPMKQEPRMDFGGGSGAGLLGSGGGNSMGMGGSSVDRMDRMGSDMGSMGGGMSSMGGMGGMGGMSGPSTSIGGWGRGGAGGGAARRSDAILVRNLPMDCNWQMLKDRFHHVGDIKYAEMKDRGVGVIRSDRKIF